MPGLTSRPRLAFHPLTAERWNDLVTLFGVRGACGGCWCMTWRLSRAAFVAGKGDPNKRALRRVVTRGEPVGVLAYDGASPVAWCAVAPRASYPALERSRILAPLDAKPVWSITCLFVAKGYRRLGVSSKTLRAAADYAASRGARIVEGYPVELAEGKTLPDPFVWTGLASSFRRAGFRESARRSPTRPIMRRAVRPPAGREPAFRGDGR